MSTNHAPGPDSSRPARSHGRRKSAADARVAAALLISTSSAAPLWLGGYFGPLPLPDAVVHAVVFSVAAVLHRRLPELDAVVVGARRLGVVFRTRALLDLFHVRTGVLVRRGLAERERLFGLHFRAGDPVNPFVGAVRV